MGEERDHRGLSGCGLVRRKLDAKSRLVGAQCAAGRELDLVLPCLGNRTRNDPLGNRRLHNAERLRGFALRTEVLNDLIRRHAG